MGENLICQLLPFLNDITFANIDGVLCAADDGSTTINVIATLVQLGLSLIFVVIIAIAIFYIIKSAITYIQSEGNEEKVTEAQKAIKAVFIGIGALFVGILGLVLLITIFGANTALNTENDFDGDNPGDIIQQLTGGN